MSRKLALVVILLSIVLFGDGKAIRNRNFPFNTINTGSRTEDERINENYTSRGTRSGKVIDHYSCAGNCNENDPTVPNGSKQLCPYENKELCLIFSLSKIAKVQVASLSKPLTDHASKLNVFHEASNDAGDSNVDVETNTGMEEDRFDFGKRNDGKHFQNPSEKEMKSPSVHCRAIRDVYIPEVKQNLPAYACKFGNNTFVLSSERFLEDRRSYLDIRIDEDTVKNIKYTPKISRSNKFNAIPALLILNVSNNDYRIEMRKDVLNDGKANQTEGYR
ncbi:uncharacterized protein LOC143424325 [Xylocopa sonorina]|uniref:uncharacterized protein LOC143424325 n=1 Tax=Xylocopa sonorina TaxID=1818115 RepID=UPI00403AE20D